MKIPPEFDIAPNNQRIEFVQELWDRIAQDPDCVPIPDEHKRILKERLDAYQANLSRVNYLVRFDDNYDGRLSGEDYVTFL